MYAIAERLTGDGIPSPSGHDPDRNPHRQWSGGTWSKGSVRAILINPRYTGSNVWNKQRKDEVLLDIDDVGQGYATKQRWNDRSDWIVSDHATHRAIISADDFQRAQDIMVSGPIGTRLGAARRDGPTSCGAFSIAGICDRRMQGQMNNEPPPLPVPRPQRVRTHGSSTIPATST